MAADRIWKIVAVLLGLIIGPISQLCAADTPGPRIVPAVKTPRLLQTTDVALSRDNVLLGHVSDKDGQPLTNADVLVTQGSREITRVVTDERGAFQAVLPNAGLYLVSSGTSVAIVRAWIRGTAPPNAVLSVTVEPRIIRSQTPLLGGQGPQLNTLPRAGSRLRIFGSTTVATVTGVGALAATSVIFGPDLLDDLTDRAAASP